MFPLVGKRMNVEFDGFWNLTLYIQNCQLIGGITEQKDFECLFQW